MVKLKNVVLNSPTVLVGFPLFSLVSLACILAFSSELYGAIVIINSVAFLLVTFDTWNFFAWLLVFEVTILTAVSCLVLESRSFRRTYALLLMVGLTLLASVMAYWVFNANLSTTTATFLSSGLGTSTFNSESSTSWIILLFAVSILLIKVPVFPFSVWLPEAHVEASWPGSLALAGFSLKFATVGCLIFVNRSLSELDLISSLILFSVTFGTIAIATSSDIKKLVANLSIIHMAMTVFLLVGSCSSNSELFLTNFSWHHHSIVTGSLFLIIGWVYGLTASRIIRFFASVGSSNLPIFLVVLLLCLTLSLDLPWTSNVFVELEAVQIIGIKSPHFVISLIIYFILTVTAYLKLNSGSLRSSNNSSTSNLIGISVGDLSSDTIKLLAVSFFFIISVGFGLESE